MGLHHEIKKDGIDVMGIKAFGIRSEANKEGGESSFLDQFLNQTADQCVKTALDKCQSGVHFGSGCHEVLGTFLSNVIDMLPFEGRMFVMSDMAKQFIYDQKNIKI